MPNFAKNRDKVMPGQIKWQGETINFKFRPAALNDDYYQAFNAGMATGQLEPMYDAMCKVIAEWDLTTDYVLEDGEWRPVGPGENTENDRQERVIPLNGADIVAAGIPQPLMVMIENRYSEDARNGGLHAKKS